MQEGEVKKVRKKGPYAVEYRRSVRYIRPEIGAPAAEARLPTGLKPKPLEVEAGPKEPLVDVFDRGDYISVASLPNVREEDLKIKAIGDVLKIGANVAGTKIKREVSIPEVVRSIGFWTHLSKTASSRSSWGRSLEPRKKRGK